MKSNSHQLMVRLTPSGRRLPDVYLPGKIRDNCWRHELIAGLREHSWDDGPLRQESFTYIGPFFVGCDHGCYHSPSSHGSGFGCWPDRDLSPVDVARLCREAVERADLLFCFIDSPDCYGTIAEIERAHTLGIRVVIAFASGIAKSNSNDFWFICTLAHKVYYDVCECKLPILLKQSVGEIA